MWVIVMKTAVVIIAIVIVTVVVIVIVMNSVIEMVSFMVLIMIGGYCGVGKGVSSGGKFK